MQRWHTLSELSVGSTQISLSYKELYDHLIGQKNLELSGLVYIIIMIITICDLLITNIIVYHVQHFIFDLKMEDNNNEEFNSVRSSRVRKAFIYYSPQNLKETALL